MTLVSMAVSSILSLIMGAEGAQRVVLVPSYPHAYDEAIALYALTGHANRAGPLVWLNASSQAPEKNVPVMWSFPEADVHWMSYLSQKGFEFNPVGNASFCNVLSEVQKDIPDVVKGLVIYEASQAINALPFLSVTAAGILDAVPVSTRLLSAHACMASLPVLLEIPKASTFSNDIAAYQWGVDHLLANTSKRLQAGACRSWQNYTCGWGDPLGSAAIDVAVAERAFVHNLSPEIKEQAAMFQKILSHLGEGSVFTGWAEPESAMIAVLSPHGTLQLCGAPNLSFLRVLQSQAGKLPYHRAITGQLDSSKHYVIFQSNEGDTPKNAYSFRQGNWLSSSRGTVPLAWGVDPLIAETFPGLWQYYVETASPADQFFAATGGLGYTYPWSLPNKDSFFKQAGKAWQCYMPMHNWVDLWEGGLNVTLYQEFRNQSNFSVDGFSQQNQATSAVNTWLDDGTPLFLPDKSLWYPEDKGYCNSTGSLPQYSECVQKLVTAVLQGKKPPFFVLIYGQHSYADVAKSLQETWRSQGIVIIGTQDLADLGRQASPGQGQNLNKADSLELLV
eukprot:gnl/MRDRNA2_/MRDRNA2_115646_c0_seq1.p1 gnl/MRDRNA2_/MRDRNA2_115646_c0~~gnl/MRDRNA2_/MRDRNA2_115646_c0_seq1.p1  ORF type:complete len:561 (-),score=69.25 gnl/MRDRNA2_/MRDRNA2_115646_c0_seq1:274-1956(-)